MHDAYYLALQSLQMAHFQFESLFSVDFACKE